MARRSRKSPRGMSLIRMRATLTLSTCRFWKCPLLEIHRPGMKCAPVSWNMNERRRRGFGLKRMMVMAVSQIMRMVAILNWDRSLGMTASIRPCESIPTVSDRLLHLCNQSSVMSGLMVIPPLSRHLRTKVKLARASRN